jgi:putative endonuclease
MLRDSPDAAQRSKAMRSIADHATVSRARCSGIAAGDGRSSLSELTGVPVLRSSVKNAASRPGHGKAFGEAAMSQTFYVYILASRYRGTLYIGISNDIARRVGEHKSGAVKAFTQRYKVNRLVYFEAYGSILEARARERALKRWRREWKFDLIEKLNPDWHDLTPQLAS